MVRSECVDGVGKRFRPATRDRHGGGKEYNQDSDAGPRPLAGVCPGVPYKLWLQRTGLCAVQSRWWRGQGKSPTEIKGTNRINKSDWIITD